ncbi:MAG TPA: hypothetical protein VG821_05925 [Rhizomicrobium sp.]|nr:hypothetical protein [Rhizomicrobium sp.]
MKEKGARLSGLLTAIISLGGLARPGSFGLPVTLPWVMEPGLTPLLWLWPRRVSSNSPPE